MIKKGSLIILLIIASLLFIPNVYAKEEVRIINVEQIEKSENVIEKSIPTYNGLEMNYNLEFKILGEYIKYKVTIQNDTKEKYELSSTSEFSDSKYFKYQYQADSKINPKEKTDVIVTITYVNQVPDSALTEGRYHESNKALIQLNNKSGVSVNPSTGHSEALLVFLIIFILIDISFVAIILISKNKKVKSKALLVLLVTLLLPTTTYAIEKLTMTMNINVEIAKGYQVSYVIGDDWWDFSDQELQYFDVSNAECGTIYMGEMNNNNKITRCDGDVIYNDPKYYSEGQLVDLKPLRLYYYEDIFDSDSTFNHYNCEYIDERTIKCDEALKETKDTYNVRYWEYNIDFINYYKNYRDGYTYKISDFETMDFNRIDYEEWEEYGYFEVSTPNQFKMPKHNVMFVNSFAEA